MPAVDTTVKVFENTNADLTFDPVYPTEVTVRFYDPEGDTYSVITLDLGALERLAQGETNVLATARMRGYI